MAKKKSPDELAQTIKDAMRSAVTNRSKATGVTAGCLTYDRHYRTYENQLDRFEKALAELVEIAKASEQ